jgi:hypothetical protein
LMGAQACYVIWGANAALDEHLSTLLTKQWRSILSHARVNGAKLQLKAQVFATQERTVQDQCLLSDPN